MADGKQIHSAMYPGSFAGDIFSEQISVNIRQHALEADCFVVNATAWLDADQQAQIMKDTGCSMEPISSGCYTAIVSPERELIGAARRDRTACQHDLRSCSALPGSVCETASHKTTVV